MQTVTWQDKQQIANCGICGQPAGECYRICPNHPDCYTQEREREDEATYGMNREDWDANYASAKREAALIAASETGDEDAAAMAAAMPVEANLQFSAEFPLVRNAEAFAARISEPGWRCGEVVRKGRKVSFNAPASDEPGQPFGDYLETVGYYGSTQRRQATLNGVKAPFVW
jgi:hypothetical protein